MNLTRFLAFVAILCVASFAFCGTERISLNNHVEVDVLFKDDKGELSARKGTVDRFSDARYVVCIEYKDNVMANCLVIDDDGDPHWLPTRLLEEKI